MKLVTPAVDGWAVAFGTARRDSVELQPAQAQAALAVPNVMAHPSTASIPIAVLLLLCGFNEPIKG